MKNKRVCVDLDNTLCDLTGYVCDEINLGLGLADPVFNQRIETYNYLQNTYGAWIEEFWTTPGIYDKHIKPLEGSIEFIRELIAIVGRFNVSIVTATPKGLEEEKKQFCFKNYGISNVICTHEKWKHTKGAILIDDYWKHCMDHLLQNDDPCILFNYENDYPYADAKYITFPITNKLHRADSYKKVLEIIKEK
jgi:5'(3')-deoxyribonucleotidase